MKTLKSKQDIELQEKEPFVLHFEKRAMMTFFSRQLSGSSGGGSSTEHSGFSHRPALIQPSFLFVCSVSATLTGSPEISHILLTTSQEQRQQLRTQYQCSITPSIDPFKVREAETTGFE